MIAATAARPKKPSDSAGSADLICSAMPEVENEVLGVASKMTVRMMGREPARATPSRTAATAAKRRDAIIRMFPFTPNPPSRMIAIYANVS